jgi:hypothetical protein
LAIDEGLVEYIAGLELDIPAAEFAADSEVVYEPGHFIDGGIEVIAYPEDAGANLLESACDLPSLRRDVYVRMRLAI